MTDDKGKRQYHPAFRALTWGLPIVALGIIAALLILGNGNDRAGSVEISPPATAGIPYVGFAEIDTIIAGATEAFGRKRYEETARLLTRARFFIHSGISEGRFDVMPPNLELILGLSEFYRGYPVKGILFVTSAATEEPMNETYSWYLGLMHLSQGNDREARMWLEKTASLGGVYADSARTILGEM
jgi:hypothetical protein